VDAIRDGCRRKVMFGVNKRVSNIPIAPAKADDSDAISINQSFTIQKVNGAIVDGHRRRNFLGRLYEVWMYVEILDLQNEESFARQRLGSKSSCPRTIDPKPVRSPAVG